MLHCGWTIGELSSTQPAPILEPVGCRGKGAKKGRWWIQRGMGGYNGGRGIQRGMGVFNGDKLRCISPSPVVSHNPRYLTIPRCIPISPRPPGKKLAFLPPAMQQRSLPPLAPPNPRPLPIPVVSPNPRPLPIPVVYSNPRPLPIPVVYPNPRPLPIPVVYPNPRPLPIPVVYPNPRPLPANAAFNAHCSRVLPMPRHPPPAASPRMRPLNKSSISPLLRRSDNSSSQESIDCLSVQGYTLHLTTLM